MSKKRRKKTITLPPIGKSGRVEIHMVEVQDPYERDKKLVVAKNVMTTPIDLEHARGRITDDQKLAADKFLWLYEQAEIGGARAIDYSNLKVDTSPVYGGLSITVMDAAKELKDIRFTLGRRSYELLVAVAGNRVSIEDIAKAGAVGKEWDRVVYNKHIRLCLRESLDELVGYFGIVAKGQGRGTIRAESMGEAA